MIYFIDVGERVILKVLYCFTVEVIELCGHCVQEMRLSHRMQDAIANV